ncbi:dihydrodipicolinate synthase family protein [Ideonella sp. BN130291]|uniref:dihydrodipicolinate synthase family protein n=1 Tax=Ideonella sp. BN130291 TaxID=3112940 RepID=UPI002E254082|nr:dihydrodipicolinate synthase family protein [Ideonella sp. BN130291]
MSLVFLDGVLPAITTPFTADDRIDHEAVDRQVRSCIEAGCTGIVALGSLGEVATLSADEKRALLRTVVRATSPQRNVVAGIAALATADAVAMARMAADEGASALMVLPPYVYSTDAREMQAHVSAVMDATPLPCILYNNPIAYRTDFLPAQVAELCAQHANLVAIKESSADVRRLTALRALLGGRLRLLMGVDDLIVEGIGAGATGWIAGLVDALPQESVRLFDLARAGRWEEARRLYEWFLPLLRLDTVPKFVQLIKLTQEMVGVCSARVRAPRLQLQGEELAQAQAVIRHALANRPTLD